ncbi:MAG: KpsF/GutQ family sugar-phosphate isomerase [Candidatus Hydrothermia bacterium]|nr:KpsF/GutQ family sugar-phosphate isomerase [Candidatus Hydrothermia bacterium]
MNEKEILNIAKRTIDIELETLFDLKESLDHSFIKAIEILYNCKGKVIFTGIGKSGHIARKISSTFSSTGTPSIFLHPAEAIHGDLGIIDKEDVLVIISNSGETEEIINIIPYLKFLNVPIICITGNINSTLAQKSDVVIDIKIKREACPFNLAPTSSTTAILVLGDALAITLMELKGFTKEQFAKLHPGGLIGKRLKKVMDIMHSGEKVPIVYEDMTMKEAIIEITSKGFGATAVLDRNQNLIGIITDGDLRRYIEKGNDLNNGSVKSAMTKNPKTIKYNETVADALNLMEKYKITVLLVLDENNKLIGILHLHDILREGIL